MLRKPITDYEPRVMRHVIPGGAEEFAVHEVYFSAGGEIETYTEDALSPRGPSVEELRALLTGLLTQGSEAVTCGDLGYEYDREYVEEWIQSLDRHPPLDYVE